MPKRPPSNTTRRRQAVAATVGPNRIKELAKAKKLTYAQIGDAVDPPAHEVTIAKLATGKRRLTQAWMVRLARVLEVSPAEIIEAPASRGLRRVQVIGAAQANEWADPGHTEFWPQEQRYDVMIPDDPTLRSVVLYAVELKCESMNKRYRNGSVLILQRITGTSPSLIREGRRFHVRSTRASDGKVENTIKTLVKDNDGIFWLKPESSEPNHQEWTRLEGNPGLTIELVGYVRYVVQREDC